MDYSDQLKRLYAISMRGIKLGLDNIRQLDAWLGHPSQAFPAVHVAGSNGKGSVATKIAAGLQASGKKVGLYTSPHIATFRERVRIKGTMIAEEEAAALLEELFALIDRTGIPATFFELTTLLAFVYFARQKVDIGVLEVGLGGRLDSTNIASTCLSVITSISLEHTGLLGDSLEAIAREKAGVIKPSIPILAGPRTTHTVIEAISKEKNSPYIRVEGAFRLFDEENRAIARRAMELLALPLHAIAAGQEALPPCRLERVNGAILDVGHNPDGLAHLFDALQHHYPQTRFRVVCALSREKDLAGCLATLKQHAAHVHLTESPSARAAEASHLESLLLAQGFPAARLAVQRDVARCVQQAQALARAEGDLLVICGTFFIMAPARAALGIVEPRDPVAVTDFIKKS